MRLAIMQPYLFPYLGYFQLINSVDIFVVHDDVQHIKGGWINRNKILLNGDEYLFSLPVKKDSSLLNINKRYYADDNGKESYKILRIIQNAYQKAPFFNAVYCLIKEVFSFDDLNISNFNGNQLILICKYLRIETPIVFSSDLKKNNGLKAERRVLNINKVLKSDHYINPIGGIELYNKDLFAENGVKLSFLNPLPRPYCQFKNNFISGLSIIDVMMFNSIPEIVDMLNDYELF